MIKNTRDYYDMELKERKGEIFTTDELPVDLAFATFPKEVQLSIVIPYLVNEDKAKLYLGIQANAGILETVKEKVGELKLFNDVKSKGPKVDTQAIIKQIADKLEAEKDDMTQEEIDGKFKEEFDKIFNEKAKESQALYKKEKELTTEKTEIKIHNDFLLVPQNVELKEFQKIRKIIDEEGYSVYSEKVFVEIL